MKKKILWYLCTGLFAMSLLTGCGSRESTEPVEEDVVTVIEIDQSPKLTTETGLEFHFDKLVDLSSWEKEYPVYAFVELVKEDGSVMLRRTDNLSIEVEAKCSISNGTEESYIDETTGTFVVSQERGTVDCVLARDFKENYYLLCSYSSSFSFESCIFEEEPVSIGNVYTAVALTDFLNVASVTKEDFLNMATSQTVFENEHCVLVLEDICFILDNLSKNQQKHMH